MTGGRLCQRTRPASVHRPGVGAVEQALQGRQPLGGLGQPHLIPDAVVEAGTLDGAEDADRRLLQDAGVGQPGQRERRSRVVGVGIVDELGLEKIITLGAPNKLSKLDPSTLPEGFHIRATFEEFAELAPDVKSKARFVELYHADDPVPLLSIDMLWRRPDWMPANRIWKPGISFLQHVSDVTTSISRGTGGSLHGTGGHEYRNMKALRAFAEVMNLRTPDGTAISAELVETAAKRAQDTSVAAAGRLRDSLLGRVDVTKPTPAPPVAA